MKNSIGDLDQKIYNEPMICLSFVELTGKVLHYLKYEGMNAECCTRTNGDWERYWYFVNPSFTKKCCLKLLITPGLENLFDKKRTERI